MPRTFLPLMLIGLLGAGCAAPEAPAPRPVQAPAGASWAGELAQRDRLLQRQRDRFARTGGWMVAAEAADTARQRARLSGDPADLALAEALLAQGFAAAPEGSGPWLAQARLDLSLHRPDRAAEALSVFSRRALLSAAQRRAAADLRATLDIEQGRLDAASAHWAARDSAEGALAMARIARLRGDPAAADRWLVAAGGRYHGLWAEPRAWIAIQRALLDLEHDAPSEALAHLDDAEAALPGYWLVAHHRGDVLAAMGQHEAAAAAYRRVLASVASPETQEALGALLLARGAVAEGMGLLAAAEAAWAERLAAFPAATAGHAAGFALRWDETPARGRALAEADARLRPSGPVLAQLSAARLADDDPEGAWQAAQQALATGARTPAVRRAAAQAAQAVGAPVTELIEETR